MNQQQSIHGYMSNMWTARRSIQAGTTIPTYPYMTKMTSCCLHLTLFVKSSSCHQGISSNPKLWGWFATSKESLPHKLSSGPWDSPSCDLKKKQRKLSKNETKFLKQHPWPRTIIHFNATWDARQGTPWIQHRPSCAGRPHIHSAPVGSPNLRRWKHSQLQNSQTAMQRCFR